MIPKRYRASGSELFARQTTPDIDRLANLLAHCECPIWCTRTNLFQAASPFWHSPYSPPPDPYRPADRST